MTNMPDALTVLVLGAEQSFLMFCLLVERVKRACEIGLLAYCNCRIYQVH